MEVAILENKRFRPKYPPWIRSIEFRRALLLPKSASGFALKRPLLVSPHRVSPCLAPPKLCLGFRAEKTAFGFRSAGFAVFYAPKLPIGFRDAQPPPQNAIGFRAEKTAFGFALRVSPCSMPQKWPSGFAMPIVLPARIGRYCANAYKKEKGEKDGVGAEVKGIPMAWKASRR